MSELFVRNEHDRQRLIQFIGGLDLSKPYKAAVTQGRSKRSDAQNRLLWTWNSAIQTHLRDHFGQLASAEEWHEILVAKLWPAEVRPVELPDGPRYRVGRAKPRKFTIEQMTQYLELLDQYCAEHLQLLLPHPEDLVYQIWGERWAA